MVMHFAWNSMRTLPHLLFFLLSTVSRFNHFFGKACIGIDREMSRAWHRRSDPVFGREKIEKELHAKINNQSNNKRRKKGWARVRTNRGSNDIHFMNGTITFRWTYTKIKRVYYTLNGWREKNVTTAPGVNRSLVQTVVISHRSSIDLDIHLLPQEV